MSNTHIQHTTKKKKIDFKTVTPFHGLYLKEMKLCHLVHYLNQMSVPHIHYNVTHKSQDLEMTYWDLAIQL